MSSKAAKQIITYFMLLMLGIAQAHAIIIRHDRSDAAYVVNESDFPQLFFLHTRYDNKLCVATLISELWAITAGHCAEQTPLLDTMTRGEQYPIRIAGQHNAISKLVVHPDFRHPQQRQAVDLALIRLEHVVQGIRPVDLYHDVDEKDQVLSLIGWGYTGEGTHGLLSNDGKMRRAENSVMFAGKWLEFLFDDPRELNSSALPLEGVPSLGDSGGPALVESAQGLILLGVALGEIDNSTELEQGHYGAVSLYERISTHYHWIIQVITEQGDF
jgi:secreted trypsin-like serine protease